MGNLNLKIVNDFCQLILFVFWVLIASYRLVLFQDFTEEILRQVFPREGFWLLLAFVPITSFATAALLFYEKTKKAGFILSTILMGLYTGYVGVVWVNFGSSEIHLFFNLIITAISGIGLILTLIERRNKMR